MAKFYGTAGTRRGSVGNEVYYIQKTQNIVRRLPAFIHNPRTVKQQTQRIRMKNCLLGLKNVKSELDLSTFANQEVIENKDLQASFDPKTNKYDDEIFTSLDYYLNIFNLLDSNIKVLSKLA